MRREAVFLDRDDTLIRNAGVAHAPPPAAPGDLFSPDLVELLPGVGEACRELHQAGLVLIVVTNQGCVARGAATPDDVEATNARVGELLGGVIDAFYYCPFHPSGTVAEFTREHPWRKPAPGMIEAASAEFDLEPAHCWIVGDAERDTEAGRRAGIPEAQALLLGRDVPDLLAAARRILASRGRE